MISENLKSLRLLWHAWDIRILIVISLLIQILLTLLAPYRKQCATRMLMFLLWFLYLAADTVALYAIGLISRSLNNEDTDVVAQDADLLAFWSPFLLLHLGGPDTITALALEDNELWHRRALQLGLQVLITLYVMGQTISASNKLSLPMVLMFVNGFIKYTERPWALYVASMDKFRGSLRGDPEAGPNYARLMEEYSNAAIANIPTDIHGDDQDANGSIGGSFRSEGLHSVESIARVQRENEAVDLKSGVQRHHLGQARNQSEVVTTTSDSVSERWGNEVDNHNRVPQTSDQQGIQSESTATSHSNADDHGKVQQAFDLFNNFKGLLADSIVSLKQRKKSRDIFLNPDLTAPAAFRVIEIALNFVYDVFYTKAFLLLKNERHFRLLSFPSLVASFLLFSFRAKRNYHGVDVQITYVLLVGAISLDLLAALIYVLSDWWIVPNPTNNSQQGDGSSSKLMKISSLFTQWLTTLRGLYHNFPWPRQPSPRWCNSISSYNLLDRFLDDRTSFCKKARWKICSRFKMAKEFIIGWDYVYPVSIDDQQKEFIMKELTIKALLANDIESMEKVCSARGNLVFQDEYFLVSEFLRPWTVDIDYDESVLIWHLATDICYAADKHQERHPNTCDGPRGVKDKSHPGYISKNLSDYMLYLLLRQQTMVSSVAGMADIRFDDTMAEAQKFMDKQDKIRQREWSDKRRKFCGKILQVKTDVRPIVAKGDKSKSVLFDACRLAKQLKMLGEDQWEITSKVWLELLCYAAIRCPPRSHIAQLKNGGELITLVWLLMAQLGLGEHFRQNQGYGWTKLIICK